MQTSGSLAVSGMLYFVNILINILTSIFQSLYGPNHQGQQHTDEREKTNHLILYYNVCVPQSIAAKEINQQINK